MVTNVSMKPFTGSCETCGGPAELHDVSTTALIQKKGTGELGAMALQMVNCEFEGHGYYVAKRGTEVYDPFPPSPAEDD